MPYRVLGISVGDANGHFEIPPVHSVAKYIE